ncbi:MAG: glycosyltransferase family 39 protein [Synechococcus sp. ELA057]
MPSLRGRLIFWPAAWPLIALIPLLITAAPHSPLAHDAGYYSLQARWLGQDHGWLAPLWFQFPIFDRCIGAQWLMALALRLSGGQAWALELPARLAALASLGLSGWLALRLLPGSFSQRRSAAVLTVALLALTPLWLNYAHLATQDMLLLAVELAGLSAVLACEPERSSPWVVLAGLSPGLAFLIKGFMVVLPLLAVAPYLVLERRWLLRRSGFWLGVLLGWLPVAAWLALSIQHFGLPVVAGLWQKLLYLSGTDVYSAGPLYYLWNIPANTAPWILAALAGWILLWRLPLNRGARLLLLLYPLLLLLLLSGFRTKTPYYGLQLTPWIAMAAAVAVRYWSSAIGRSLRRLDGVIALVGAAVLAAGVLLAWPDSPARLALAAGSGLPPLPFLTLAAIGLGISWLLVPLAATPRHRQLALLLGPWLALALLVQGGLFSDRSPATRLALAPAPVRSLLAAGPIQAAMASPLSGDDHAQLILLALATNPAASQLLHPETVPPGQRVWVRRSDLKDESAWQVDLEAPALQGWVLAQRRPRAAGWSP